MCEVSAKRISRVAAVAARPGTAIVALAVVTTVLIAPASVRAAELTVSTTADATNGDVSSPDALVSDPGPDGISLREAILAANNASGPHEIGFSAALGGQTISLSSDLPSLTRDYVSINGFDDATGEPAVTLDGSAITAADVLLFVDASNIAIRRLRFERVYGNHTITIGPGLSAGEVGRNFVVEDSVFDQSATTGDPTTFASGVTTATNEELHNVVVNANRFLAYPDPRVAVSVSVGGTDALLEDVAVHGNYFTQSEFPIEVNAYAGSQSTIRRLEIVGNTFAHNDGAIIVIAQGLPGDPASGHLIEDTLIARNLFSQNDGNALALNPSVDNTTGNTIRDTTFANNVLDRDGAGPNLVGDPADANTVEGVEISNNSIASLFYGVRKASPGGGPDTGVSGVDVTNTIFRVANNVDFVGPISTAEVHYSIVQSAGLAGVNGNVMGDPKFVDPANGDLRLQPGSPAIDAGTSDGTPTTDFECGGRVDDPATANTGAGTPDYFDIGAFEFGATTGACPSLDTTPPRTVIDSGPPAFTVDPTPTFSFSSSELNSTFQCRVDGGAHGPCGSPLTTATLSEGPHAFYVWALDTAGNADVTAASWSFTVDTSAPETTIDSGPSGVTADAAPIFTFSSSESSSSFECGLDDAPYAPCASPKAVESLADGAHTFSVRATDAAGNADQTPANRGFTVQTAEPYAEAPETTITKGPSGKVTDRTPTFKFRANSQSTFECRLDDHGFRPCDSPKRYRRQPLGAHIFRVRATDSSGRPDPTPARRRFKIVRPAKSSRFVARVAPSLPPR